MAKAGKILILASALLYACVTDFQSVAPPTALSITIQNDTGALLDGADVFIFDNVTAFNQTVASGTPAGFVSTTKSSNGNAQLDQLSPEATYYIYAQYKDISIIPGSYITYDNSGENYLLKNKLIQGSISSLRIILKPADGLITFWTAPTNNAVLPIAIFSGSTTVGSVTQTFSSSPAIFTSGAVTLRARKGTVTIEGKSASGCLWVYGIALAGGQNISYKLEDCSVGTIAFWTDNTNATKLPITLKLNANDLLANLTAVSTSAPLDCSASNLVAAVRVPGTYTYEAISSSGNCIWTGSVAITANGCTLIALPTCP